MRTYGFRGDPHDIDQVLSLARRLGLVISEHDLSREEQEETRTLGYLLWRYQERHPLKNLTLRMLKEIPFETFLQREAPAGSKAEVIDFMARAGATFADRDPKDFCKSPIWGSSLHKRITNPLQRQGFHWFELLPLLTTSAELRRDLRNFGAQSAEDLRTFLREKLNLEFK